MKDLQYITHDLGARNDPKLLDLQMEMGGQGLAIFWCLVEMLWENDGRIPANYKSIAFALRWCKPAEVERVVTGFNLFQVEDGMISSRSASERIAHKRDQIEAKREGGRKGAERRWNGSPNSSPNGIPTTDPMLINKLINKQINKETNNNMRPTAADFFEVFFFENVKDPAGEACRFVKYYEDRGWTFQDGTPVTDPERAAKDWKPIKAGPRCDTEALRWYKAVWIAAKNRVDGVFLSQLTNISRKGQHIALRYQDEPSARKMASFITENDLAGDWLVDYRIEN